MHRLCYSREMRVDRLYAHGVCLPQTLVQRDVSTPRLMYLDPAKTHLAYPIRQDQLEVLCGEGA